MECRRKLPGNTVFHVTQAQYCTISNNASECIINYINVFRLHLYFILVSPEMVS